MAMEEEVQRKIRRHSLKPITIRGIHGADRKAVVKALERLAVVAMFDDLVEQNKDILSIRRKEKAATFYKHSDLAVKSIAYTRALYEARRINTQRYVFLAIWEAEMMREERWMSGQYDEQLIPIGKAMKKIEKENGLKDDEYWRIGEGPEEYELLNKQYNAVLNQKFIQLLKEVGLSDLASMKRNDPSELDRLYERGRRSAVHANEYSAALRDIVIRYEKDAQHAASVKAYTAAITLLGAGAEGLLLLRCMRSKQKARQLAKELPNKKRPQHPDDPTKWTFEQLIEVCLRADWLVPIETTIGKISTAGLAHVLKNMRNQVHPGRLARESPWLEIEERDYLDAEAIYRVLLSTMIKQKRANGK